MKNQMLKIYLKVIGTIIAIVLLGVQIWINISVIKFANINASKIDIISNFLINSFPEQVTSFNESLKIK
jgi:hypothetical protein